MSPLMKKGIEIVNDRYGGAVKLHDSLNKVLSADPDLGRLLHADVVKNKVHLIKVRVADAEGGMGMRADVLVVGLGGAK